MEKLLLDGLNIEEKETLNLKWFSAKEKVWFVFLQNTNKIGSGIIYLGPSILQFSWPSGKRLENYLILMGEVVCLKNSFLNVGVIWMGNRRESSHCRGGLAAFSCEVDGRWQDVVFSLSVNGDKLKWPPPSRALNFAYVPFLSPIFAYWWTTECPKFLLNHMLKCLVFVRWQLDMPDWRATSLLTAFSPPIVVALNWL